MWERFKTQSKKGAEQANLKLNLNPLQLGAQGISEVFLILSDLVTVEQQLCYPMKGMGRLEEPFVYLLISQTIKFYQILFLQPLKWKDEFLICLYSAYRPLPWEIISCIIQTQPFAFPMLSIRTSGICLGIHVKKKTTSQRTKRV